jgi:hypothetical protein
MKTPATSMRLTAEDRRAMSELAARLGVRGRTEAVRIAVQRALAEKETRKG